MTHATTKIGCGMATSATGKNYVTCRYSPAGNINGQLAFPGADRPGGGTPGGGTPGGGTPGGGPTATVTSDVDLYDKPSHEGGKVIRVLRKGQVLKVVKALEEQPNEESR
jgi:hypothetical protein